LVDIEFFLTRRKAVTNQIETKTQISGFFKFLLVYGLIAMVAACLLSFFFTSRIVMRWKYIAQAPPGAVQVVYGAGGYIYVQDQANQVYSCKSWDDQAECWIPDVVPNEFRVISCNTTHTAFEYLANPPSGIVSCIQTFEVNHDGQVEGLYALDQEGKIWSWAYGLTLGVIFFRVLATLVFGVAGSLLGNLVWTANYLVNRRKAGASRVSTLLRVVLLAHWVLVLLCLLLIWMSFNPVPSQPEVSSQDSARYTAVASEIAIQLTQAASQKGDLLPRELQPPAYDLAALVCQAHWKMGFKQLLCSDQADQAESPFIADPGSITLEGNPLIIPALAVPLGPGSQIMKGLFPPMEILPGDHFKTSIGCLDFAEGCDVVFEVSYVLASEERVTLGRWAQLKEGQVTEIDLDLAELAGQVVQFQLYVYTHEPIPQVPAWVHPVVSP